MFQFFYLVFVYGVYATNGTITGLQADTSYNVTVAIYTSKDVELGQTEPVIAATLPTGNTIVWL